METGIIFYMMDNGTGNVSFDLNKTVDKIKERSGDAHLVEAAADSFDLVNAWNQLMDKGVDRVIFLVGKMVGEKKVFLSGREINMSEFDSSEFCQGGDLH